MFKTKTIYLPKFLGDKWIEIDIEKNNLARISFYERYKISFKITETRSFLEISFIIPFVKRSSK